MIIPQDYPSSAISSFITFTLMCCAMPGLNWIARKLLGPDTHRESFMWGFAVFGPFATRLLDPLIQAAFK
jgi:hypothetical protein